jgi:hypothetical protein
VGAHELYVLGGWGDDGTPLLDLVVLDVEAMKWSVPPATGQPPAPRYRHSASLVGSLLVVMGGSNKAGDDPSDTDRDAADTAGGAGAEGGEAAGAGGSGGGGDGGGDGDGEGDGGGDGGGGGGGGGDADGESESFLGGDGRSTPRSAAAAAALAAPFCGLHVLDLGAMRWRAPTLAGDPPFPRSGHSAVAVGQQVMTVNRKP